MTDIDSKLAALREVRWEIARLQAEMQPYSDAEAEIRAEIQAAMQAGNVKTVEGHGIQAQRAQRSTTVITDKDELTAALDPDQTRRRLREYERAVGGRDG